MVAHQLRHSFLLVVLATYALIFSSLHTSGEAFTSSSQVQETNSLIAESNRFFYIPVHAFSIGTVEKVTNDSGKLIHYTDNSFSYSSFPNLYKTQEGRQNWHIFIPHLHGIMPQAP